MQLNGLICSVITLLKLPASGNLKNHYYGMDYLELEVVSKWHVINIPMKVGLLLDKKQDGNSNVEYMHNVSSKRV